MTTSFAYGKLNCILCSVSMETLFFFALYLEILVQASKKLVPLGIIRATGTRRLSWQYSKGSSIGPHLILLFRSADESQHRILKCYIIVILILRLKCIVMKKNKIKLMLVYYLTSNHQKQLVFIRRDIDLYIATIHHII